MSDNTWNWPGARWWRVDLHTHSPASSDFKPTEDREAEDWRRWLEAVRDAGIQAVAITDHNTAAAIGPLKAAMGEVENCPVVFPGVEITVNNIHLLGICSPDSTAQNIEHLLSLVNISPDKMGHEDAYSNKDIEEILGLYNKIETIFIGAHVNSKRGLMELDAKGEMKIEGQKRIAILNHQGLAAVEIHPDLDINETVERCLNGRMPKIPRIQSRVWCSDGHKYADLGRRFTWIKMTKPNFEGLRLALLDGEDSLRPVHKGQGKDPNQQSSLAIEEITVHQAKHIGREKDLVIPFNPWFNAIIGGRGTGKSTLIDCCRKVLRRDYELEEGGELRDAFDKRLRVYKNREDDGLLTKDSMVEMIYRKDGERFSLKWDAQGEKPAVSRLDAENTKIPDGGDISERFPVRIYSQKQLFELASRPRSLLAVIDDSDEVDGASWRRKLETLRVNFLTLRAQAREYRLRMQELPSIETELSDVKRKIKVLEEGGNVEVLNKYRMFQNQDSTWESIKETTSKDFDALESSVDRLGVADMDMDDRVKDTQAGQALGKVHGEWVRIVAKMRSVLAANIAKASSDLDELLGRVDNQLWQSALLKTEQEYHQVSQQLADAGIATPNEYQYLLQKASNLEQRAIDIRALSAEASAREKEAQDALEKYRLLRTDYGKSRRKFAEAKSSELVRIRIQVHADNNQFGDFLRDDVITSEGFVDDRNKIVDRLIGDEDAEWNFSMLDKIVDLFSEILENPEQSIDGISDQRFLAALRRIPPERLDQLALYLPGDGVEVVFRDLQQSGDKWSPISQGSPGQKTAALLAFVLGYGNEPIVLDQPEDDLDNTLIYDLLVQRIREIKVNRQIIIVTHNPNIVVHGDAELVISLDSIKNQTVVWFSGGLQEQRARDEICRVMEGGADAFKSRYRRIMPLEKETHG